MTDGSVRVALVDLQENSHGVLGLGDKKIPRGTAFHTPLYATAKVLEKNQISAGGYVECPFDDVKKGDYFYEPVVWAVENGVTNGINKNTFSPSLQCTRGQVMTFLCRATENAYGNSEVSFNDVGEADYFYNAVKWAVSNEITKGTSETTFSPNELCTSAQIITFIWRANGSKRVSAKGTIAENYDNSVYYKDAVAWADSMGILEGTQKSFSPDEPAMRCDVLTYIYRIVNK